LIKPSIKTLSEQIIINIINISQIIPSFRIFNKQKQLIGLVNYSLFNRTLIKTNIIDLPLTLSLCQFNLQTFEILITNITKGIKRRFCFFYLTNFISLGSCLSNQYRCQDQWCIDEIFRCDGYHSCPQGIDESNCPSKKKKHKPKLFLLLI
jgi:hypothetical protein